MNDDDRYHGAVSESASAPPSERERAISEVCARIAAAAQRAELKSLDERLRDAPPPPPPLSGPTLRSPPAWVAPPAGAEPSPAPVPGHAPHASPGPVVQAPTLLKKTAPMPAAPAEGGALPFRPAPAAEPPQKRVAPPTVQSRVVGLGETAPVRDESIEKAVSEVLARVALPQLTLRQFASLCAELAFQPDRRGEILERYMVRDEVMYAALDAHWRRERAARPEVRTVFADDFATHMVWLHMHGL
jgi:hypothetical protein